MIPDTILEYLDAHRVRYQVMPHPRAVGGQELAAALHESGHRVAKSVLVRANGRVWMAVLAVADLVNLDSLANALGAASAELLVEREIEPLFPTCELGAEPPFGRLYGLAIIVDSALVVEDEIVVRAGSHRESLKLAISDYLRLEKPALAAFSRPQWWQPAWSEVEVSPGSGRA
jgi:Ala-tRNA(Pro) deacylase